MLLTVRLSPLHAALLQARHVMDQVGRPRSMSETAPAEVQDALWHDSLAVRAIQKRTVRLLIGSQVLGGVGVGAAASLGALLAESITNTEAFAGLARTASTLGAAAVGLPLALLAQRYGRRAALSTGWVTAAIGGAILVLAATGKSIALLIVGMLLFGAGNATNLQSRYAAADLAGPRHRARALSVVLWSTTIGAVVGPNLATPGASVASALGLPSLAGAFLISSGCLAAASVLLWIWLRPDPLLLAQQQNSAHEAPDIKPSPGPAQPRVSSALDHVRRSPLARFAFVTVVLGHTTMGAVMTMTPVSMARHGTSLMTVGLTISIHVLGMYAFAPVVGRIADRVGQAAIVWVGQALFVGCALLAGLSDGSTGMIMAGLFLLGLGWSCSIVAGSAMLSYATPTPLRPTVQGVADSAMNVLAAAGAGVSGPLLHRFGFGGLNTVAALLGTPVMLAGVLMSIQLRRGE